MGGMGGGVAGATGESFPLDIVVQVYGIIYIYNPPQEDALGIEQVDQDTVIEGTGVGEGRSAEAAEEPSTGVTSEPSQPATPDGETPDAGSSATTEPPAAVTEPTPSTDPPATAAEPAAPASPTEPDPNAGAALNRQSLHRVPGLSHRHAVAAEPV